MCTVILPTRVPALLGSGVLASWAYLGEPAIEDYPGLGT